MNLDDRAKAIYEYLLDIMEMSPDEVRMLKKALSMLHEISPVDKPLIFKKMEEIISASDDLSWIVMAIKNRRSKIKKDIDDIKAPAFTALTRQGRPSTIAVEYEIKFTHDELSDLEESKEIIDNILDYVQHVQKCLDDYSWMLRDKLKTD